MRVKLDRGQPILPAEEVADDPGRARVAGEGAAVVRRPYRTEIRREQTGEGRIEGAPVEAGDAALPFAGPARLVATEVVQPDPGMGIEDAEGGFLRLQPLDEERRGRRA